MSNTKGSPSNGLTRREFLVATSASAAGLALAGQATAQDQKKPVTIGTGKWTYTLVEGWPVMPEGVNLQMGCAVVVDSRDRIYVHSQAAKNVVVFDRMGKPIKDWGMSLDKAAHGTYLHREGTDEFLFFSILGPFNQIVKTDLDGKVLLRIGNVPEENSTNVKFPFNNPTDVAVAPNGDIWVCEGYGGQKVHRFNAQGKFIQTVGESGTGPGQFRTPHGIWIDTRKTEHEVWVADRSNSRLQIFDMDGKLKRQVKEGIRNPCCFYQYRDVLFVPDLDKVVSIIDRDDKVVAQLGDGKLFTDESGFKAPHALTIDSHGDLYVVEWVADGRLRKYKRTPIKT